ncbi:MAG: CoA transferase, partial [Actinomycetota bacterium]|nr:CoA transferase [Actinomycetota bacterium]
GLLAAVLTLAALKSGRGHLLDVSLAGTARWLTGDGRMVDVSNGVEVAQPRARNADAPAREMGVDTASVMAGLLT